MPEQKPNTKKDPVQTNKVRDMMGDLVEVPAFIRNAQNWFQNLAQNWQKGRDIVKNNYDLGLRHLSLGNLSDAVLRFKIVTWLDPKHADAWYCLGSAYQAQGKIALAQKAFRQTLNLNPNHEEAAYMLAVVGGKATPVKDLPKKMPITLVESHFDGQAADFSRQQLEDFSYQGHVLVCEALRAVLTPGYTGNAILELGVGSGLCGPLIRDVAARLTGIDISAQMINEAGNVKDADGKKIYDVLIRREIVEYLAGTPVESCDIILSAGVFSYVGNSEAIFLEVTRVLKHGGIFAFSADQMLEGQSYRFDPSGARFRFSKDYLKALASANGLQELSFAEAPVYPKYNAWIGVYGKP